MWGSTCCRGGLYSKVTRGARTFKSPELTSTTPVLNLARSAQVRTRMWVFGNVRDPSRVASLRPLVGLRLKALGE